MRGSAPRLGRRLVLRTMVLMALGIPLTACGRSPVARRDGPVALMSASDWKRAFDDLPSSQLDLFERLSVSADSNDHYPLAYGLDAYTMMFDATGDATYLDRALQLAENTVASAAPSNALSRSQYRDGFLTWVSEGPEVQGEEVPLNESYAWRYVIRALRVLRSSALIRDPRWRRRHDALLGFGERNIFDKWYARDPAQTMYRSRTHMASHWAFIAMNLEILTDDPQRRERCRRVKESIDNQLPNYPSSLRAQLRQNGSQADAYVWSDEWNAGPDSPQDVSHGNNVVSYIVEATDLGRGWTADDVARFGRTLDPLMWPEPGDEVAEFVDGTGSGDGWLSDGFAKLGRYDPVLQTRLQGHNVQDPQFVAAMATNAARLSHPAGR